LNEDLIIKRFQERAGYRLADVAEVGLPVYSVNVQVLTLAHKRLPPIEEFLLRCLSMNLSSVDEISQYLGLTREVLKPAFANLAQTENIALAAQQGMQSWTLTKKGNATLQASEIIAPEERTFQIHFDAILRKPTLYRYQKPLKHKELGEEGLIEIEIYPPKRPQLDEISPGDIERVLKAVPGLTEQRRDVLAIRSIENIRKGFIRAVALLFKGTNESEVQLAFIIDGMLSMPHELAFARTEAFKRLITLIMTDPLEEGEVAAAKESVEVSSSLLSEARDVDTSTLHAEVKVAEQTEALRLAESEKEKEVLRERLTRAEEDLEKLRTAAKQLPVRDIYVLDHPPLLQDALLQAKRRVMIISPWIRAKVVNHDFIKKLELLLKRQVAVYIGFGTSDEKDKTENMYDNDRLALEKLRELAQNYPNFCLDRLGNTHAKVLIKDSEFVAVTSFNWLSFRGDPDRTFRDEQGTLVQQPGYVDNKFNELVVRFKLAP
jgi:hypothetical protein